MSKQKRHTKFNKIKKTQHNMPSAYLLILILAWSLLVKKKRQQNFEIKW